MCLHPLPPDPPVDLSGLYPQLDRANQALGRLDGLTTLLPNTRPFLYLYVRKEALLSSQIEGTKSSFSDLLLFENEAVPGVPIDDVEEVSNYVAAMQHGLRRIKGGFPLSLRLIREFHAILLRGGCGANKTPGEFRRSQNWIGGSRPGNAAFVPPPPERMMECLDRFEHFLHDEKHNLPVLVEAGLIHVQFETIHPFLDGNGRLGRLLITLLLCAKGTLRRAASLFESFLQGPSSTLLRSASASSHRGSLGRVARVFSGRHRGYGPSGGRHGRSNSSSFRGRPEKDSSDGPQGCVKLGRSRIPASTSADQDRPGRKRS